MLVMPQYDIIAADPNWNYNSRCAWSKSKFGGGANKHYQTSPTDEICRLPVKQLASKRSVCLMWATCPKLPDAFKVMAAWGFKYSTIAFVWVKTTKPKLSRTWKGQKLESPVIVVPPGIWAGPGYYTRSNVEIVLLGTRGRPLAPASKAVKQVIMAPHDREWRVNKHGKRYSAIIHSRKPAIFLEKFVELFGDRPRVELFARERTAKKPHETHQWEAIGDQLEDSPVRLEPAPFQMTMFDLARFSA